MRRLFRLALIAGLLCAGAASVAAARDAQPVPELTVGRLAEGDGPVIDGRVDEASWSSALEQLLSDRQYELEL